MKSKGKKEKEDTNPFEWKKLLILYKKSISLIYMFRYIYLNKI